MLTARKRQVPTALAGPLVLVAVLFAICLPGSVARAATLYVSADAHIDGTNTSANFGTNEVLSIEQSSLGGNKAYLRFDASSWAATNFAQVPSLRFTWASSTNITRTLFIGLITGSGANDWTETGITWADAPANNVTGTDRNFVAYPGQTVTLLTNYQYQAQQPIEIVLNFAPGSPAETALRAALNTGDRKITVGISYNSSSVTSVGVYSREYNGGASAAALEVVPGAASIPPLTDAQLFGKLDLNRAGLEGVRAAVLTNNYGAAKAELARYYRNRAGTFHYVDSQNPAAYVKDPAGMLRAAQPLLNRTGDFDAQYWDGDTFDWESAVIRYKERTYFFDSLGQAAAVESGDDIARALITLVRSFAFAYKSPSGPSGGMWTTMSTGIRMRSGWPVAFQCLLHSPAFTDEDIVLFLKTVWDQTDYIYRNPSETSNWLTFEMAGLYTSGVVYPEFRDAYNWRGLACERAMSDIDRGWLPDGMSIELSASYGTFFSNYFFIYDLASFVNRLQEFRFQLFPSQTERLFEAYLKLMAPDRTTACINDGGQADVISVLEGGVPYFPARADFKWVTSKGKQGSPPAWASVAFPYAGYLISRSGWETNANYMFFEAGPVGYRHAHQDKLNVVMWTYGRQILFDSPQPGDSPDWTYLNYIRDTFAHSTGLVDNRPQRRRWYNAPTPASMPYQPLTDFYFSVSEGGASGGGSFAGSYGKAGSINNDSYPYKDGGNFYEDWVTPAVHWRKVAYSAPDLFIVQDLFVPNDSAAHTCEIRWQLDSTNLFVQGQRIETKDANLANLAVIPLQTGNLQVGIAKGQLSPEVMGWKLVGSEIRPATTLRHTRAGAGMQTFLTMLFPVKKGATSTPVTFQQAGQSFSITMGDGRVYSIIPAADPSGALTIQDGTFKDTDGDGIPDWWEMKYFSGPTSANPTALAANKLNTVRECYLAGLDPANSAARFEVRSALQSGKVVLSWSPVVPERTYTLLASTNLAQGFEPVSVHSYPLDVVTNSGLSGTRFYRVSVQRPN